MKQYNKNPRKINTESFSKLKRWLVEFGDLGCIVHDSETDEIICGNQRFEIFNIKNHDVVIEKEYAKPTNQGTVAEGYVIYAGERFKYRKVLWNDEQRELACVIANKAGGVFDFEILLGEFEFIDFGEIGFEESEFIDFKKFEEFNNNDNNVKSNTSTKQKTETEDSDESSDKNDVDDFKPDMVNIPVVINFSKDEYKEIELIKKKLSIKCDKKFIFELIKRTGV
jgi:hypothetical protein